MRIIDADGHVVEPEEIWEQYLPRRYWPAAPRWVTDNEGRTRRLVGGRLQPHIPFPPAKHYHGDAGDGTRRPDARLADFDRHGIDVSVISPSAGLHFGAVAEADVQAELCRAYNRWIADFCAFDRRRLRWIAVLPQSDICLLVEEAEWAVSQGATAVLLRPNPIGGRTLDDPSLDPLWRLLEESGLPLVLHEATTMNVPEAGTDRYTNYMYLHAISQPQEHQMASVALVCGGVLERHPELRVAFFEAGAGWVPYWVERMDQHVRYWGHASRALEMLPSEYFLRQCFVSPFADESMLPQIIDCIGAENLVFSSDYPMPYTVTPRISDALLERDDVDVGAKELIGGRNAERLYGIAPMEQPDL